jgi:hypothetical protein
MNARGGASADRSLKWTAERRAAARANLTAFDPNRRSAVQTFCVAKFLFDHLIGSQQKCFGDGQPDRFGGLEVDHQPELGLAAQGSGAPTFDHVTLILQVCREN